MRISKSIPGYTVMELMVVLIISGLIISFIYTSFRRTSEQLKMSETISEELNDWITVRSTLFKELYFSDSIIVNNQSAEIFFDKRAVYYENRQGEFWRKEKDYELLLNPIVSSIYLEEIRGVESVVFEFNQKDTPEIMSFPIHKGVSRELNAYFSKLR